MAVGMATSVVSEGLLPLRHPADVTRGAKVVSIDRTEHRHAVTDLNPILIGGGSLRHEVDGCETRGQHNSVRGAVGSVALRPATTPIFPLSNNHWLSLQPETLPALLVDVEDPGLDLGHYLLEVVPQAVDAAPGMTDLQIQRSSSYYHKYYAIYLPDRRQYHSVGSPRSLRVPRPYPRRYSSGYPSAP